MKKMDVNPSRQKLCFFYAVFFLFQACAGSHILGRIGNDITFKAPKAMSSTNSLRFTKQIQSEMSSLCFKQHNPRISYNLVFSC